MVPIFDAHYKRAGMRINLVAFLLVLLAISAPAHGQPPAGFHWVDFKREFATVQKVEQALKGEEYTAVREIVLADGFALVTAVRRESWQTTPAEDQWLVYSVSTQSGDARKLLIGYDLQIKDWFGFTLKDKDLGVIYLDCDECEPASLFTALHYDPREGWRARWANEKSPDHPGITLRVTDVGDPYTNEDVDQVFAVITPKNGVASIGTWYHSRDLATGKISDDVGMYSVDPSTGRDKSIVLTGPKAKEWELRLCHVKDSWLSPAMGQSTRTCKGLLSVKRNPPR